MAKVKYFDGEKNLWGERKPPKESVHPPLSGAKWVLSTTDLKEAEPSHSTDRLCENFCEFLGSHQPTIALLHCTQSLLSRVRANKHVRKNYALVEPKGGTDEVTVALVLVGIPVEASDAKEVKAFKTVLSFTAGNAKGASLSMIVAFAEPGNQRVSDVPSLKSVETDATIIAWNAPQSLSSQRDSSVREALKNAGYADALEKMADRAECGITWGFGVKSSKYEATQATMAVRNASEPRSLCITLALRSPLSALLDVPISRSTKTGAASVAKGGLLTDPAILSAEVSRTPGSEILMMLKKGSRWSVEQSFSLKPQDGKLTPHESAFDVSRLFSTVGEAVDWLNSGGFWPAEYCVVYSQVLYTDMVTPDRQSFRRYAKDNAKLVSHIVGNGNGISGGAAVSSVCSPVPPQIRANVVTDYSVLTARGGRSLLNGETVRKWSESSSIIIYQTTPREMKFNITHLVPLTKDVLRQAISYLNKNPKIPQEQNPLYDYRYDYALLQSVEHQGFWLIAAMHVPCDIVACRMVV